MKPPAETGEAKPVVREKLAPKHKLKVEKPSQLSEKKLPINTQLKLEKPRQLSGGDYIASKPPAKSGEVKPAMEEKVALEPPAKRGESEPAVG